MIKLQRKELVQTWRRLADWAVMNGDGQSEPFQEVKLRVTLKELHLEAEAAFLIGEIELRIVQNDLHTTEAISRTLLQVLHEQGYVIEAEEFEDHQRTQQYKFA